MCVRVPQKLNVELSSKDDLGAFCINFLNLTHKTPNEERKLQIGSKDISQTTHA